LGVFTTEIAGLRRGERVALRTERGSEAGDVVEALGEVKEGDAPADGELLRVLAPEDEDRLRRIAQETIPAEMKYCSERIKALELPMKLVDAEHLLGGEKIIFYFVADGRVDFRQLVKDIAREYRTRIELRQIGVRDEARLLSELGHCGQRLCCKCFMKSLEPVTMRMAKSQKATLDPTKISGVCGRLMCCLRYEDRVYSELKGKLPKRGSFVTTAKGSGKVVDCDILAQMVAVKTANANLVRVRACEILSVEGRPPEGDDEEQGGDRGDQRPPEAPGDARREGEAGPGRDGNAPRHGQDRRNGRGRHGRNSRNGGR